MDLGSGYLIGDLKSKHTLWFHIMELGSGFIISRLKSYHNFHFRILENFGIFSRLCFEVLL